MSDNPSGQSGVLGAVADWFDSKPVTTPLMTAAVAVIGLIGALSHGGFAKGDCAKDPLAHVYKPQRLTVVATCQDVTGTVLAWRHEHDGDDHVSMKMDDPTWTNVVNVERQHGVTVVEFVPLMSKPKYYVGQRLRLRCTKVYDQQHKPANQPWGWVECHPVFAWQDVTPAKVTPAPNQPSLAPPTEEDK